MRGWSGYQSSPITKKTNPPVKGSKYSKSHIESVKYLNDAEDQLEFLNEDLFNKRITKAEYDAKKRVIDMKIEAARKALGHKE